jgi:hypothetical protein
MAGQTTSLAAAKGGVKNARHSAVVQFEKDLYFETICIRATLTGCGKTLPRIGFGKGTTSVVPLSPLKSAAL